MASNTAQPRGLWLGTAFMFLLLTTACQTTNQAQIASVPESERPEIMKSLSGTHWETWKGGFISGANTLRFFERNGQLMSQFKDQFPFPVTINGKELSFKNAKGYDHDVEFNGPDSPMEGLRSGIGVDSSRLFSKYFSMTRLPSKTNNEKISSNNMTVGSGTASPPSVAEGVPSDIVKSLAGTDWWAEWDGPRSGSGSISFVAVGQKLMASFDKHSPEPVFIDGKTVSFKTPSGYTWKVTFSGANSPMEGEISGEGNFSGRQFTINVTMEKGR